MASYLNHHWGWSDIGPAWPTHGLRMGDGTFPKDNRNAATKRKATEKSNMLGNQRLLFFPTMPQSIPEGLRKGLSMC